MHWRVGQRQQLHEEQRDGIHFTWLQCFAAVPILHSAIQWQLFNSYAGARVETSSVL